MSGSTPRSDKHNDAAGLTRRTVMAGSAWAVPAVTLAAAVPGAVASTTPPDSCPSFDPCGLYGSSGSVIFQYSGEPATTGSGFTVQENSGQFASSYWSSSLAFGPTAAPDPLYPDCEGTPYVFYGSRYSNAFLSIYRARAGADGAAPTVEVVGDIPRGPIAAPWGGLACDLSGDLWMVSNLTALSATQLAKVTPLNSSTLSSTFVMSGQGLVGAGPNAAVASSTSLVIPDITFSGDGRMYGLVLSYAAGTFGQVWLCEYLPDTLTEGGQMSLSPLVQVTGPAATTSTNNYGFAWLGSTNQADSGAFYSARYDGQLYRIDPATGVSEVAGSKTSPATYDYALTDLASSPLGGCTI